MGPTDSLNLVPRGSADPGRPKYFRTITRISPRQSSTQVITCKQGALLQHGPPSRFVTTATGKLSHHVVISSRNPPGVPVGAFSGHANWVGLLLGG